MARIDWTIVLDDLADAGAPPNRLSWSDLNALTHVVLATDRATGRFAGVLGMVAKATSLESFLLVDTIMVDPDKAAILPLAMLAHTLARIVSLDGTPPALAARRGDRGIEPVLRALAGAVTGAMAYPAAGGPEAGPGADPGANNVIALCTASLARRVGRGFTTLDLRQVAEPLLLRDLRKLHRARRERKKSKVTQKLARSAGAMRRPRTTTRTGKSA